MAKKKSKAFYLVYDLQETGTLIKPHQNPHGKVKLSWAPGMVGVMPVFRSKKAAIAYKPDETQIIRLVRHPA